jgi:hypothetical protein
MAAHALMQSVAQPQLAVTERQLMGHSSGAWTSMAWR